MRGYLQGPGKGKEAVFRKNNFTENHVEVHEEFGSNLGAS